MNNRIGLSATLNQSHLTITSEDSSMMEESAGSFQSYRDREIPSVKPLQLVGNC